MKAPPGVAWNAAYRGLSAEEIYPLLTQVEGETALDEYRLGEAPGAGSGPPRAGAMREQPEADSAFLEAHRDGFDEVAFQLPMSGEALGLAQTWRSRLAASALEAARTGRLAAHWGAIAHAAMERHLPWRGLLERFLSRVARDDYSFARRSRREGEALLPGMESGEANLVVAIDTSGSIPREALERFIEEVDVLKAQIRASVALLLCDAALAAGAPPRFFPWERIELPEGAPGGGGTRFTPVFDWVRQESLRPDALLYFTDAEGEFPETAPEYPVLWLVIGNAPVPFGERVQLN